MQPDHLSIRLHRRLRALGERARFRFGLPAPSAGATQIAPRFRHPIDANRKEQLVARYRRQFPDAVESEIAEARRLAAHEFDLLGHRTKHGASIAWSLDPVSGREWSRGFAPGIPYRGSARLGDIKLPWELNKHQYFFTLGKAAWLTGDEAFALEILRQIDHWITDNPYGRGIHWISALETGTRAVSWILSYPFYSENCDAALRAKLTRSIGQHMLFVERHLSLGRFANTHLVGEAAALVIGGLFLECRHSARWMKKGMALLEEEIRRQSTPDGVHVERSAAYHRFFLDQYYLVDLLLQANGMRLHPHARASMQRMTDFLMDVMLPDGSAISFGDGDDARGIWMRADCSTEYRSLLAMGAVLFDRGDFKSVAGGPTEELLWLLGEDGLDAFQKLTEQSPSHESVSYPDGGYDIMRGGWGRSDSVLAFDCGPLGHGPAGHGHADALSFQLHAGGYPFLVDPGTYSYNLDYGWRDEFRSTRAHNTVIVDDQDQSVAADRMSWREMARVTRRRWTTTQWFDLSDGEHDGYLRLVNPALHRRAVMFLKPDVWLIWDSLNGTGIHSMASFLHLRPDCMVNAGGNADALTLHSPRGSGLRVWRMGDDGKNSLPDIVEGNDDGSEAWFSPTYGVRVPTRVLRYRNSGSFPFRSLTCLSTCHEVELVKSLAQGSACVSLHRSGSHEATVFWRPWADGPLNSDAIRFDGEFLYCRYSRGALSSIWAEDFNEIEVRDVFTIRSNEKISSLSMERQVCTVMLGANHSGALSKDARNGITIKVTKHDA